MSNVAPLFKTLACVLAAADEQDSAGLGLPDYGLPGTAAPLAQPAWMSAPAVYVPLFDAHEDLITEAVAEKAATQPTLH